MTPRRRLLAPALSTAAMLAALLALGTWQLERRAWKQDLLDQFAAAERAPAVPLVPGLPPFAKVRATGTLRGDLAAGYGAELRATTLGTQLIVPLEREGAPPLLVDLGWVPTPLGPAPTGAASIEGYLRPGERPGWFSASDDPARRSFYTLDPPAIGAALGLPAVAPDILVALGPPGSPDPARHLPELANNHLQYAITWYSLAAVLLAIFVTYVRRGRP